MGFLFHAYILFCGPLCYQEPWAMLSPSVQCVITFDMCLSWLKASLKQWAWARDLSRCIRMGPYRSILYQDTDLHTSRSLELVLLVQSLVIPHCAVSAVWLQSPCSFYVNSHQPHPFQPCLTCVISKENIISWAFLLDFSIFYHLTAALAKLPVCALLHWKRTNLYFWSQSFSLPLLPNSHASFGLIGFQELFKREMRVFS